MNFDDEAICVYRDRRTGVDGHELADSRRVARVHNYRKMSHCLEDRNRSDVESVACGGLEGTNPALAENDIRIAVFNDALRRAKKVLDLGAHAALQKYGSLRAACGFQERVVFHTARTDLKDVRVLTHQ